MVVGSRRKYKWLLLVSYYCMLLSFLVWFLFRVINVLVCGNGLGDCVYVCGCELWLGIPMYIYFRSKMVVRPKHLAII
jgi:hypothetical protein